jgi:PhnB protein
MPLGPTFWADTFGMLTDRYGTSWMISGGMKQQPQR